MTQPDPDKPKTTWQDVKKSFQDVKDAWNEAVGQGPVKKEVIETNFRANQLGVPVEVISKINTTVDQFALNKDARVRITVEVLAYTDPVPGDML